MQEPQKVFPFPTTRPQPNMKSTLEMSLAEKCKYDGIQLMYVFDRENPITGGFSVAFRPSRVYKSTIMIDMAISYCRPNERFNKKIGRDLALKRFLDGQYIQVPALRFGEEYVHDEIRRMFAQYV